MLNGHEVIPVSTCSKKTLSLGTKYSPEMILSPMKNQMNVSARHPPEQKGL